MQTTSCVNCVDCALGLFLQFVTVDELWLLRCCFSVSLWAQKQRECSITLLNVAEAAAKQLGDIENTWFPAKCARFCLTNPSLCADALISVGTRIITLWWEISGDCYLADAGHSGHRELRVTVQLQGSFAEEEVDLVVVALLAAAALPHQGRAHEVRLCEQTQQNSIRIFCRIFPAHYV